jgi:hypothetical protein
VHHLGETDSYHLWIVSKIADNHKKILLTVKQQLKLREKFENRESVTELAKDYGIGTVIESMK